MVCRMRQPLLVRRLHIDLERVQGACCPAPIAR
ncbi:putative leader peptide [uncultured Thermomonospora sp.]|uniref:Uncharacterized protein n=1 Tax=Thermomonospora curvata (strain ATCC 19995 / DSM 43183 / JCM 3096 / KCTC 9072 / NBRC 15933 / NCIMB 10081 / Henssen B9) TaxID=471852 RepID=D1AAL9_THECD|nr:hypothetical protein Tcur_1450 [Thermomonospora curvata DSM 43183]